MWYLYTLQFQGSDYKLMAVIYGNGTHFMTRYQTSDGHIYDYDGTSRYGSDFPVTRQALCVKRAEIMLAAGSQGWSLILIEVIILLQIACM